MTADSRKSTKINALLAVAATRIAQYDPLPGADETYSSKLKTYVAYAKTSEGDPCVRITSVDALDEEIAKHMIHLALNRAGRRDIYKRWKDDGQIVREEV